MFVLHFQGVRYKVFEEPPGTLELQPEQVESVLVPAEPV